MEGGNLAAWRNPLYQRFYIISFPFQFSGKPPQVFFCYPKIGEAMGQIRLFVLEFDAAFMELLGVVRANPSRRF